jgi:NAD(P)H-hydrate repair Nnr-like enzyme with NAD(P)H-hydrate dehydratase domain
MSADLSKFLNGAPAVKEQVPDLSAKANAPGQKKKLEMVSSVTATGSASVTLSGSGDIIASGSATGSSSVTLAGTGDVSSSAAATGSASVTITGTASAVSKGKGSASASAAIAGRGSMRCAPRTSPLISHRPMAQIEIYSETWADPTEEELTALLLVEL